MRSSAKSNTTREAVEDRFELRVCREMWRRIKEQGLVYVRLPFARRIRMVSVLNRRNPDVLFDMIRSHALINLYRRERRTLRDGRLALVATEEDFHAAASLFVDLHTTGGSLTAKFDRNEQLVLLLASRYRAEQFTVHDVQRWTGWNYQKARRVMLGYDHRGVRYPGLLDKTPALSLVDETVSDVDGEGPDVKRRALVFTFEEEAYRTSRYSGQVWLAGEDSYTSDNNDDPGVRPGIRVNERQEADGSRIGGDRVGIGSASDNNAVNREGPDPPTSSDSAVCTAPVVRVSEETPETTTSGEPCEDSPSTVRTPDGAPGVRGVRAEIDPHGFVAIDGPEWEPCAVCSTKPSHYREKWARGMAERRRLCKRCYGAAVEREQAKVRPLPAVIDPSNHAAGHRVGRPVRPLRARAGDMEG